MLIWKGHGILIIVFGVIGGLVCGVLTTGVYAATHWSWMLRFIVAANFWGAAAAIWLYAKTMGKTVQQTYLDPTTHRPVVIRTSHSLFFIPPGAMGHPGNPARLHDDGDFLHHACREFHGCCRFQRIVCRKGCL